MTDLLEGGPPQRRRRWPTALGAVLVVATLVVGAVQHLSGGGSPDAGRNANPTGSRALPSYVRPSFGPPSLPAPTTSPAASAPPSEVYSPVAPDPPDTIQPRLVGVPLHNAAGVSLVMGGTQLVGVGSRAAGLGSVPVPAGGRVYGVQSVGHELLVTVLTGDGQSEPSSKVYLLHKGAQPRLLASTDGVFPAFDGQSIFAIRYFTTGKSPNQVTRIDLSGHVLSRHVVPGSSVFDGDTAKGLLIERLGTQDHPLSTLQLLDRTTFAVTKTFGKIGWVAANTGARAAWTTSECAKTCTIVMEDLRTGKQRKLTAETGFGMSAVTSSPDGERVAIAYFGRHPGEPGGQAGGFVEVTDLVTGARHRVPGVVSDAKQAADLSWTPDGRWLAIAVGITDKGYRVVGLWPTSGGPVQIVRSQVPGGYTEGALLAL